MFISAASAHAALPGTASSAAVNGAIEAMVGPLATEALAHSRECRGARRHRHPLVECRAAGGETVFLQEPVGVVAGPARSRAADVAQAIVMLAENGFVTGTVLVVDGGGHLVR